MNKITKNKISEENLLQIKTFFNEIPNNQFYDFQFWSFMKNLILQLGTIPIRKSRLSVTDNPKEVESFIEKCKNDIKNDIFKFILFLREDLIVPKLLELWIGVIKTDLEFKDSKEKIMQLNDLEDLSKKEFNLF